MSKMAPNESMLEDFDINNHGIECNDHLLIIIEDKNQHKKDPKKHKKHKKKNRRTVNIMLENEQFIQIKGIQKTQEAVNRSLRKLQLDKMRISRNKRVEEASENIRKRRELQQQKQLLKEVLPNFKVNEDQLHDDGNLNERNNSENNIENRLKSDTNTQLEQDNGKFKKGNKELIYNDEDNKEILPPLTRTTRKRPYPPMASVRKTVIPKTSSEDNIGSNYKNDFVKSEITERNLDKHKRSIVITIPDVNTDASFIQGVTPRITKSATSSRQSSRQSAVNLQSKEEQQIAQELKLKHPASAKSRLTDLPPVKFTLQSLKGPPVSYYVEKGNMVSYRPTYGIPVSKFPDERGLNPTMMVSPRNSSASIPQIRVDYGSTKDNLSIIGKNMHFSQSQELFDYTMPNNAIGKVSGYEIRSSISPDSSRASSRTPPRHSMKGSKLIRKKSKETSKNSPKYSSATGFVISEVSMQDRSPKKPNVQLDKQPVSEFPVHVRERFIKKKLLMAQTDRQDTISWKVRKYITDPVSISTQISRDETSLLDINPDRTFKRLSEEYISSGQPNKKDISDLLLRMLLKQHPRNQIQKERTVPSEDKILSSLNKSTGLKKEFKDTK